MVPKHLKCKVCGLVLPSYTGNRPNEYCSANCRDLNKFFNAFVLSLDKIDFQDYEYVRKIKGDLFRVVNLLPKV